MFFRKNKREKRAFRLSNVEKLKLESENKHFELMPKDRLIKYRNVISPRDAHMRFPDGYFEEKTAKVSQNDIKLIAKEFDRMFKTKTSENGISFLPNGITPHAFMAIILSNNEKAHYSNIHPTKDGFHVEVEKVASEFEQIVHILMQYCTFPEYVHMGVPIIPDSNLLKKVNAELESGDAIHLKGYRFEANGVYGYDYYKSTEKICSASRSDERSAPVIIKGDMAGWRSDFNECQTLFPGITRAINDEADGREVFKIVFEAPGKYRISEAISVYCCKDDYTFYSNQSVIAKIKRINEKSDYTSGLLTQDPGYEPYFEMDFCDEVENELLMIMLAFPLLKFGF